MPENRVTPGMKKWRKERFNLFRKRSGAGIKHGKAVRSARRFGGGISRSVKYGSLLTPRRRSWKGPTRFVPRCRKGHPVDYDMARCFICVPMPKLKPRKSYAE